ncbi:hypothetical protein [Nocardioides hwasunensis]|uniref:Uncharacterized protein n=1 Tax=Nocardioides hwasunensis TaxID=397258 RepID=A0ABR8MHT9_9ACTN|nr:hypothetical protein [Nocardioides hwasunensis]MBD3915542.1 hypothetical protein [Nocardioides hwasunensis]
MSEEWVDPTALRSTAPEFETEVGAALGRADGHLQGPPRQVSFTAFSMVGGFLAGAYTEALNYTLADLDTKTTLLHEFRQRLESTATTWETAEEASTVETGE